MLYWIFRINFMLNKCHEQFTPCGELFCNIHEIFHILNICLPEDFCCCEIIHYKWLCNYFYISSTLLSPRMWVIKISSGLRWQVIHAQQRYQAEQSAATICLLCGEVGWWCFTKKTITSFGSQWVVTLYWLSVLCPTGLVILHVYYLKCQCNNNTIY